MFEDGDEAVGSAAITLVSTRIMPRALTQGARLGKLMFACFLFAASGHQTAWAQAWTVEDVLKGELPDCSEWLTAVSSYEELIDGELVERHSYYELGPIEANAGFGAVALTAKAEEELDSPSLIVSYDAEQGEGFKIFYDTRTVDARQVFVAFDPWEMLGHSATGQGTFTLVLRSGDAAVCGETHNLWHPSE